MWFQPMIVQGYETKIDVYVISADAILNFTLNDIRNLDAGPLMSIESSRDNNRRAWNIAGTVVSQETIPLLSKELLGGLIREKLSTHNQAERAAAFKKRAMAAQPTLPAIVFEQPERLLKDGRLKRR
ncbi:MAG: hypothetical protein IT342_12770 [Candidatus Melainabacteria bacterium]|nr:hypothetical protein [Candidatus Melainabacteria bacterium]